MSDEPSSGPLTSDKTGDDSAEYFSVYQHYSNLLRTWLMAYGIGAPVLFLTNEALWKNVASAGLGRSVAVLFIVGVSLQVVIAAVNKASAWVLYYGEVKPEFCADWRYLCSVWLGEQFWIDLIFDLASIGFLACGTWQLFKVLT